MAITVKNINGSEGANCKCKNWLNHWEYFSNSTAKLCTEKTCHDYATEGTLVMKTEPNNRNLYIIPLCQKHNALKGQEIEVMDATKFIPVNISETCEAFDESIRRSGFTE